MKMTMIAALIAFPALVLAGGPMTAKSAESTGKDIKGLFLLTDYPAVSVRPGTTSTVNLRLQNYDLPPERLALSVAGAPAGWTPTPGGGGQPGAAGVPGTQADARP